MAKPRALPVPLTTPQLIDLAKLKLQASEPPERHGKPMSDYRLAQRLGIRQNTVSSWRTGKSHIGREFVRRVAEASELPEAYVFACVELERERDPSAREILHAIAAMLSKVAARRAASLVLGVGLAGALAAPGPSQAASGPAFDRSIHYANWRRRRAPRRRRQQEYFANKIRMASPVTPVAA